MSPETLTRIGEFELKSKLGQGGFGAVYKAIDSLGREVAIKVLFSVDDSTEGFLKEAKTLAKLKHPNIVTIHHFGVDNGRPFLVMEYLDGQPLNKIISEKRDLHLAEKLGIIMQAADALQFAHDHGVVHRDVKPHNLMVMEDGSVRLIDFGIAMGEKSRVQSQAMLAGTIPYLSPGHLQKPVMPWADTFSLGVVLFELLTGDLPYAKHEDEIYVGMNKLMVGDLAPPLSRFCQGHPPELEAIVARVLSKQRGANYETAEEFGFELQRVQELLKTQFTEEGLQTVRQSMSAGNYARAKDVLQKLLRLDPQSKTLKNLSYEIRQAIQQQTRGDQVRQLCAQAEQSLANKKYEVAEVQLNEAAALDSRNITVRTMLEKLRRSREINARIADLIAAAEALQRVGQLQSARKNVEEALSLDGSDTRALGLQAVILRSEAYIKQQGRLKECLDHARSAITEHSFTAAFELIREAEKIDPEFPEVQVLKDLALNEHRQEQRRKEIEHYQESVTAALQAGDFSQAVSVLESALHKFPSESKILNLRATIEHEREQSEKRAYVQETLSASEQWIASGDPSGAVRVLEEALRRFPREQALLSAIARAKEEGHRLAEEKRKNEYLTKAREALGMNDTSRALGTLEIAQHEFPKANDVSALLRQVRSTMEGEQQRMKASAAAAAAAPTPPPSATTYFGQASAGFEVREEPAAPLTQDSATRIISGGAQRQYAAPPPEVKEAPVRQRPAPVPSVTMPGSKKPLVMGAAGVLLLIAGIGIYIALRPAETVNVAFEVTPAGARVVIGSEQCKAPCTLKLKRGTYSVTVTSDGYQTGERAITVAKDPLAVSFELRPNLAAAPAPPIPLTVQTSEDQVRISVDGMVKGFTTNKKTTLNLLPGAYTITAEKSGYETATQQVEIAKNSPNNVTFALKRSADAPLAAPIESYVFINSVAGASVLVDGKSIGSVPADGTLSYQVEPGRHSLSATREGYESASQSVAIKAGESRTVRLSLQPVPPAILGFTASATSLQQGQSAELRWDTKNAREVTIEGIGAVQPSGSRQVTPAASTTYTLVARGEGTAAPVRRTLSVSVAAAPVPAAPPVAEFSGPDKIKKGESATLVWATQNASEISIDQGIGSVRPAGSRRVSPVSDTKYFLTAKGPGGTTTQSVEVLVEEIRVVASQQPSPVTQPPAAPPAAQENPDIKAIRAIIADFKEAYQSMSVPELLKVWPGMPKPVREAYKGSFGAVRAIKATYNCQNPTITGDSAAAVCTEALAYTMSDGKRQEIPPVSIEFAFQRSGGNWQMSGRRAR